MVMALATGWGGVCLNQTDEVRSLWATVLHSRWCPTLIFWPATCLLHTVPWILPVLKWTHLVLKLALEQKVALCLGPSKPSLLLTTKYLTVVHA